MRFELLDAFPDELEADWNRLLEESAVHVPFLRFEYLRAWWQTRGGGEWPQAELKLVVAKEGEQLLGIAPLFLTANRQDQAALMLLGSIEISDYLDVIARPEHLQGFISQLLPFLAALPGAPWQVLDWYNLLDSSPTLPALQRTAQGLGWHYTQHTLQHSPYIPLPGDWEAYLQSIDKKQRHEIRRKMRRFEAAGPDAGWRLADDPEKLDEDIDAFLRLMEQDAEKAAFLTAPMRQHMRLAARCAFERGCLHLVFLEMGAEIAAGYLSFDYLDRLWVYNSGIDRRFVDYSPGWVLLGYLLQWANENKRSAFDFMRGDEGYKYRFGAVDRFVMRALVQKA